MVVSEKRDIDKETGEQKPRNASTHDLRRAFGRIRSLRVMPDVLMQHSDIDTTMKYYVGRNAQKAADVIWQADAGTSPDQTQEKVVNKNT